MSKKMSKRKKRALRSKFRNIFIVVVVLIAVGGLFLFSSVFDVNDKADQQTFAYSSNLPTQEIEEVNMEELELAIHRAAKKAAPIKIELEVSNAIGGFYEVLNAPKEVSNLEIEKEDRTGAARKWFRGEVSSKIEDYNTACKQAPVRVYGIAIDITEGALTFSFEKYFSEEEMHFIGTNGNQVEIKFFSWGFNPQPGYMSLVLRSKWTAKQRRDKISSWERSVNRFLNNAPETMDESNLLSQYYWTLAQFSTYSECTLIVDSDLLQNTKLLSAYRKDNAFNQFVDKKTFARIDSLAKISADVDLPEDLRGTVIFSRPKVSVLGVNPTRKSWNSAMESYLGDYSPVGLILEFQEN